MKLYWGDLHNHCAISYGYGSLENALHNAKKHLDFCCITGHAMWPDMPSRNPETAFVIDFHERGFEKLQQHWPAVQQRINDANSKALVTFQSYEMHSSQYGDYHFVSPDAQFPLIYRNSPGAIVRDSGCRAIAIPHHIGYTPGYRGIDWSLFDASISPVVEVVSKHGCAMREDAPFAYYHDMGPMDPRNTVAEGLRRGRRFSFVGSTDHHAGFPGSYGDGLAGVWAEGKTRESLWDALLKGHTYAVTGDRIQCAFTLNGAMMGETVSAGKRTLRLSAEGETPIEWLTIRKNGRIVASRMGDGTVPASDPEHRYILRLELGWSSSPEAYHWEGSLAVAGGEMIRVQPYLRGKNALSPNDQLEGTAMQANALDDGYTIDGDALRFRCDTFCNKTPMHPMTSAFSLEVRAATDARVTLTVNGLTDETTLSQLMEQGFSRHMKPWHSHAYKLHTVYPACACRAELTWEDTPAAEVDVYQAEVAQINGHRAYVSPIFATE